jgi:uncharacterized protein (TIGR03083 family)
MANESFAAVLAALRASHLHLADVTHAADPEASAYPTEWSVAQTLSHLGSGAEIFGLYVGAGADGGPEPDQSTFETIWGRWNAKDPAAQARDSLETDAAFIAIIDGLSGEQRDAWHMDVFDRPRDLENILRMRLAEHVVHTWDVEVASNPTATLLADGVGFVAEGLGELARYGSKAPDTRVVVRITTTDPDRTFTLDAGPDGVSLEPGDGGEPAASVTMPTEAFVRLFYGRLDADHAPDVTTEGITLDDLRAIFPGF